MDRGALERTGPSVESQTRVLLLVAVFGGTPDPPSAFDGYERLARLGFLLEHPKIMAGVLRLAGADENTVEGVSSQGSPLRTGKWRWPSDGHCRAAVAGLVGRGLITASENADGAAFRVTPLGRHAVRLVLADGMWEPTRYMAVAARRYLDLPAPALAELVHEALSEAS